MIDWFEFFLQEKEAENSVQQKNSLATHIHTFHRGLQRKNEKTRKDERRRKKNGEEKICWKTKYKINIKLNRSKTVRHWVIEPIRILYISWTCAAVRVNSFIPSYRRSPWCVRWARVSLQHCDVIVESKSYTKHRHITYRSFHYYVVLEFMAERRGGGGTECREYV